MEQRRLRKVREGIVISNKMDKTVVVLVERLVQHPRYKKYLKKRSKFKAHDARNACGVGDRVRLVETRPLSRDKRWRVQEVLARAAGQAEELRDPMDEEQAS